MNKETRTFVFGLIVFVFGQYLGWLVCDFWDWFDTIIWFICIGFSGWGLSKILKTID